MGDKSNPEKKASKKNRVRYSLVHIRRRREKAEFDDGDARRTRRVTMSERRKFMKGALLSEVVIVILYAAFVDYDPVNVTRHIGIGFQASTSEAPDVIVSSVSEASTESNTSLPFDLDSISSRYSQTLAPDQQVTATPLITDALTQDLGELEYDQDDQRKGGRKRSVEEWNLTEPTREGEGNVTVTLSRLLPPSRQAPDLKLLHSYPMFQDVHVMIFVGFGFLMTFLKKYGYSAVGYNLLIAAVSIQWATLCQGFFHMEDGKIHVGITNLIGADFASAAVLISFGAVLGKTTPLQLIVMAIIEIAIFSTNEWIGLELFGAIDAGGSMFVHVFGAYFGLMVSFMLYRPDGESSNEGPSYSSDIFAMIGTTFLWIFWPSFNAALVPGDDQHRAVINTYFALASCCVTAFALSSLLSKDNKFDMVHIQNSTLAGGVAVGTSADLMTHPYGAIIIGMAAGTLSVMGYRYLHGALHSRLRIHDTCGVHNLHGMPGVLAGLVGAIMSAIATENEYGLSLYLQFPARAPYGNSTVLKEMQSLLPSIVGGENRSAAGQAGYQLLALAVTLAIATVGGLLTGLLVRMPMIGKVPQEHLYDDSYFWEVPEEEPLTNVGSSIYQTHSKDDQDSKC